MKYYLELTVRHEDPLTHYTSEDFIDLPNPWVDVDPSQMTDEWAENRLMSGYWADFDPSTPAPRKWWETDSERDENNEYYTLLVYPVKGNAEDTDQIDWDTIVAGASMDAWDIWERKKEKGTMKLIDAMRKARALGYQTIIPMLSTSGVVETMYDYIVDFVNSKFLLDRGVEDSIYVLRQMDADGVDTGDWHIIGECFERPAPEVQRPVFLIADASNNTICFSPKAPEYEDLENYPDSEVDVMRELLNLDTSNWQK